MADLLARGLSGADGDLLAIAWDAVEELRSLCGVSSSDVLCATDVIRRTVHGAFNVCVASADKCRNTALVCALAQALVDDDRIDLVCVFTAGDINWVKDQFATLACKTRVELLMEGALEALVERLDRKEAMEQGFEATREERTLLVFDVVGLGDEPMKSITALYNRWPHLGVSVCLSSHRVDHALSPAVKANSRFTLFSQLTGAGITRLFEDMVLRQPLEPSAFEAWVSEQCVDHAFGLYDAREKALSVVRA